MEKASRQEPSSSSSEVDSDEEYWAEVTGKAPAISLWAKRGEQNSQVPRAAQYDEPKPPLSEWAFIY